MPERAIKPKGGMASPRSDKDTISDDDFEKFKLATLAGLNRSEFDDLECFVDKGNIHGLIEGLKNEKGKRIDVKTRRELLARTFLAVSQNDERSDFTLFAYDFLMGTSSLDDQIADYLNLIKHEHRKGNTHDFDFTPHEAGPAE
jgi:hypothetical protein